MLISVRPLTRSPKARSPRASTASIAAPSTSMRITTSHRAKTSAGSLATAAPASARMPHFEDERFQTRSGVPALIRFSAIGSPMAPRPMKPTGAEGITVMTTPRWHRQGAADVDGTCRTRRLLGASGIHRNELVSEDPALSHGVRLYAFPLRNGPGHLQQLFRARARSKHDPVRVAEDEILPPHQEVSEPRREQRLRLGSVQAPGPRGTSAVAEHREANPLQFSSIAMQAPDHESRHATCFGLEGGKVADACLIRSARVVDHQNMPWLGRAHRLQEDVHAAVMAHRKCSARDGGTRQQRPYAGRRHANRDFQAQARIGDESGREVAELGRHGFVVCHSIHPPAPGLWMVSGRPLSRAEESSCAMPSSYRPRRTTRVRAAEACMDAGSEMGDTPRVPDWDGLRIFLALVRSRTLAAAARKLSIDETTVARRLARLEQEMRAQLVERAPVAIAPYIRRGRKRRAQLAAVAYADGVRLPLRNNVEDRVPDGRVALRTNSIAMVLQAVRLGWGVGDLPCFVGDRTPELERAFPHEKPDRLDVWLIIHADVQRTSRVRALVDELVRVFRRGADLLAAGRPS